MNYDVFKYYEDNIDFIFDVVKDNNIYISNDRRTGKSLLSSFIIHKFISDNPELRVVSLSTILFDYLNIINGYKNKINLNRIKNLKTTKHIINYFNGRLKCIDIIFLDDIYCLTFSNIDYIINYSVNNNIKIILTDNIKNNYFISIYDFFIITSDIMSNMKMYNRKYKISNIINNI